MKRTYDKIRDVRRWSAIGRRRRVRLAFTLLELLLVLAILVVVAGLVGPSLLRNLSSNSLDKACEMVRSEMSRARTMSIRSGKVHVLLISAGGNQMTVKSFDSMVSTQGSGVFGQADSSNGNLVTSDEQLPRGVTFLSGEAVANFRSTFESAGAEVGGARPVLFYPDGTCQDARVILGNDKGFHKQVVLRGLTGTTRVSIPGTK